MAKMKMNFDWKQFFVQKGERVGVIVAAVLAVLMILPMFGFMLFGQNSRELVTNLSEPAKALKQKQETSVPTDADKPDTAAAINSVITQRPKIVPADYPTGLIETPRIQLDLTKRQVPNILVPIEGAAGVALAQLKIYVLSEGGDKILKLTGVTATGMGPGGAPGASPDNRQQPPAMYGRGGGPGGGRGGYSGGYRSPYAPNQLRAESVKDYPSASINVEDIGSMAGGDKLADMVQPARVAVVECTFPYRKQIEEFQHKLHLASLAAVMNEQAVDEPTDQNTPASQPRPTFFFKPPRVERRRVDVHGNALEDWKPIDPAANLANILYANGGRFEQPEDEWLDAVSFENMAMPKMSLMGKNQYPNVASQLPVLQDMIKKLKADRAAAAAVKKPNLLAENAKDFNAWSPRPKAAEVNTTKTGMGPTGEPGRIGPNKPGDPKMTKPMYPMNPMATDPAQETYPDYCLIRLIDVTIQPGEYYEYRLKVRMANPNYGQKNVASPAYAESQEPLEATQWFEVGLKGQPQVVASPPEYHLYAVDQAEVDQQDGKRYTGQNANADKARRAVFQIHKWLLDTNQRPNVPVGEWSVAERVLVHRGEYIGVRERVEVPYWRPTHDGFVMVPDEGPAPLRGAPPPKGIFVDFGLPLMEGATLEKPYPLLVDFEGGDVSYERVGKDDKGADKKLPRVSNKADMETLILSPDGKLLSLNSWTAKGDAERIKRLDEWHKRIDQVKKGDAKAPSGGSDILGGPQPGPMKPMP